MFIIGFSMYFYCFVESMDGFMLVWMSVEVCVKNVVIVGSVIIVVGEVYFNCLIWMEFNGDYKIYDKCYFFILVGEEKVYIFGKEQFLVQYKGWSIMLLVCYDL